MIPFAQGPDWSLLRGDCIDAGAHVAPRSVALAYIDPPFFTGRRMEHDAGSFDDTWGNDIDAYVDHLGARVAALRDLLTKDGSLLLHLDWRAVHYAKVRCDRVFGAHRLQNEIVWAYRSGGGTKRRYGRKHDTILWYSMSDDPHFDADAARVPYDATIAKKRAHLFHERGKVAGDVLDIPRPPNHAKEWTGWPSQKPLALLDWFVRVHSRPGDLVGDFFCGSGTTLVAAKRNGRRAVGCDLSETALGIARKRLE